MKDRVAVITGGGQGIGEAICKKFAFEGAAVAVADINCETGKSAADAINASGGTAQFFETDVTIEASIRDTVSSVVSTFGKINVLVNSAVVFVLKTVEDATQEDWDRSLQVNVRGPAFMARHVVPEIRKAGGGAIVNMASISSFVAQPGFVPYNTTKSAILSMTRCMALDLADDNIRVNAVGPGVVWTPIVQQVLEEAGISREEGERDPSWGGGHMIKRFCRPEEIANAVLFLASDEASFITAECLMVDGGFTAQ
jgi:dihydroanticapsin dehydrogenase